MSNSFEDIMIKINDDDSRIFVSEYDDTCVWMSLYRGRASTGVTMTTEEAKQLIAALQTVVNATVPQ